jgi:hypothetical protein
MVVVLANSLVLFWPQRLRLTLAELSRSLQLGRTAEPLMSHVPACTSKAFPTKGCEVALGNGCPRTPEEEEQAGWVAGSQNPSPSVRACRPEDTFFKNRFRRCHRR